MASRTWGARAEEWTDSRTRRPDVTCWPKPGRRRTIAGVDHTKTAYEIQLVDIPDSDVQGRTVDHKADGISATFWLEGGDEPRQRPDVAASVALTPGDQVIGVARNADVDWRSRDWLPAIDLDRFCAEHRRGLIVWQSDYGVLSTEAWLNHLRAGGVGVDRRKRSALKAADQREIAVHRSVHAGAEEVFDEALERAVARERVALDDPGRYPVACPVCWRESTRRALGAHYVLVHHQLSTLAPSIASYDGVS